MSLLSELRRRNVFRVGVAYLIVAWLIVQVTDLAAPALRLPEWVPSLVLYLLLIGLPIAIVLAWAYELTPEGIRKTKEVPLEKSISRVTGRKMNFIVIALLLAGIGYLLTDRYLLNPVEPPPDPAAASQAGTDQRKTIAVLPFVNLSDDSDQEYFADGVTEELLNVLAAMDGLRVTSRTSSFTFKDQSATPLTEIAAQLGVDHVLEGSVRKAGNTIRITAQLIDARSDTQLWSKTYDQELTVDNILQIQESVARTVVGALNVEMLPPESQSLRVEGPANIQALDLYHDGMFYMRQVETGQNFNYEDTFLPAVRKFEASIREDPHWAPAHAKLGAMYHFFKDDEEVGSHDEILRTSRKHITEAIRLDDAYGRAYGSLGFILLHLRDIQGAKSAFDEMLSHSDGSPWAYAIYLQDVGRIDEAILQYREAVRSDPLSLIIKAQLSLAYMCAERYEEAIEDLEQMQGTGPYDQWILGQLAYAHVKTGNTKIGVEYAEQRAKAEGSDVPVARTLALAGMHDRALAALNEEEADGLVRALDLADIAFALGDEDRALVYLEQALDDKPQQLLGVKCFEGAKALSDNPRFTQILDRLGLPH